MTQTTDRVTAQDVLEAVFPKPPMGKRGYDEKLVDDFLQLAARRLDGRGRLSADDIRAVRFPGPRLFRRGYEMSSVDQLLDRIADSVAALGE
jgi:DivIVA domain-containing protein